MAKIGVKRMGEIDKKAFKNACRLKLGKSKIDEEAAMLVLKWKNEIQNPAWRPFKPGPHGKVIDARTLHICYIIMFIFMFFFFTFMPLVRT